MQIRRLVRVVVALAIVMPAHVTLAQFGDAARVNVVYALRGLWGVALAWAVAHRWGGGEAALPHEVMLTRMAGALLLTAAVVLVIANG